jgi:hypothetical protein
MIALVLTWNSASRARIIGQIDCTYAGSPLLFGTDTVQAAAHVGSFDTYSNALVAKVSCVPNWSISIEPRGETFSALVRAASAKGAVGGLVVQSAGSTASLHLMSSQEYIRIKPREIAEPLRRSDSPRGFLAPTTKQTIHTRIARVGSALLQRPQHRLTNPRHHMHLRIHHLRNLILNRRPQHNRRLIRRQLIILLQPPRQLRRRLLECVLQ